MQQYSQRWPLYVVEFKAGRKDFFFVPEGGGVSPKKGDFVVVEADRGKDLGKVVHDSIRSQAELQAYQQLHHANFLDNHAGKEVHAKKIYRLAQPTELSMLGSKMADEEKAMAICQGKVRSKRLPMEVVDAEYQWDRRKLTFYFVADRRIDFRELVRDLFKIYKTRIWLCACGGQVSRDGGSGDDGGGSPQRPQRDFAPRDFAPREYAAPPPDFPPMVPVVVPPYVVGPHFRPMTLAPAPMGYVAPMPAVPYPRDVRGVDGRR
ncbi:PSP1 C-terminal conserved region-domain-containing protein [Hyaloraphidium curvatum]|nr:PSP1 C-terminal conserved region-domain-containing protein [Hyaloraphidium curvatum]